MKYPILNESILLGLGFFEAESEKLRSNMSSKIISRI